MLEVGSRLRHRRGDDCLTATPIPPLLFLTHYLNALAHRHPVRERRVNCGWASPFRRWNPFPDSVPASFRTRGLDWGGRLWSLRTLRRPLVQRRGLDSGGWLCSLRTLRRPLLQRSGNTSRTHTVYFGTTLFTRETCRCKRYGLKNDFPRGVRHAIVTARFLKRD